MDDITLLKRYVEEGSEGAFTELVERRIDLVYSAALRQCDGNRELAQEVTQMVFTDMARKARKLVGHPLLVGWLHRSVRCASLDRLRQRKRQWERQDRLLRESDLLLPEQTTAAWEKLQPCLDEALDALNERERAAVLLRYFDNLSFAEVGEKLGVPENTARMRVTRALEKMEGSLRKRGLQSSAAALALALTEHAVSAAPAGLAKTVACVACEAGLAAGAGSMLGTVGTFMALKKMALPLLGVLGLGLGLGCGWELLRERALGSELAALESQVKNRLASTEAVRDKIKALKLQRQAQEEAQAKVTRDDVQSQRFALDIIVRRGELDDKYLWLFRRLALPPEKLKLFKQVLVERNQVIYDAVKLAKLRGIAELLPGERRLLEQSATQELDARIEKLIGAEKFTQLREYEQFFPHLVVLAPFVDLPADRVLDQNEYRERMFKFSPANVPPATMEAAEAQARLFVEKLAPELELLQLQSYQEGDWLPMPDSLLEKAKTVLNATQYAALVRDNEYAKVRYRMDQIARAAAQEGRLNLSAKVAAEYGVSPNARTTAPQGTKGKATP